MGSTIPLGRDELVISFHGLSIQMTLVSGTVWPQFANCDAILTGLQTSVWGKEMVVGSPE